MKFYDIKAARKEGAFVILRYTAEGFTLIQISAPSEEVAQKSLTALGLARFSDTVRPIKGAADKWGTLIAIETPQGTPIEIRYNYALMGPLMPRRTT